MPSFTFDIYQTLAIAVVATAIGLFLKKRISFLEKFCIPSPVIGGLVFAIIICILHEANIVEVLFNDSLREVCMVFFFTSVGFQADLKLVKVGGKSLVTLLLLVLVLVVLQNGVAVGLAKLLGLDALVGMCTGSIPMTGGHGTSAAFGPIIQSMGVSSATTICIASATYGLIFGSLIGGPIANRLIERKGLLATASDDEDHKDGEPVQDKKSVVVGYSVAAFQMAIAAGIGTGLSMLLSGTGMTFPLYIGSMLSAALIRNICELSGKGDINMDQITDIGDVMLPLFLGIAMITMRIYDLFDLALPVTVLLLAQTLLMAVYARYVAFNLMGKDYDAAVITAGLCGFGMGATPNAMANMQAVCAKYKPSFKAFLLIPIIGSMFADFINSAVITLFLNL